METRDLLKKFPLPAGFGFRSVILPSLVIVAVILAGVGSGAYLSRKSGQGGKEETAAPGAKVEQKEVGLENPVFKDTAQGILELGGVDGEGTHHLVRDGGPAQYVYLTSSVVDLDQFVGRNIQVWGETFTGQRAGWLMDVGRVKILD